MTHGAHSRDKEHEHNPEQEIAKSFQELDAIENSILERFGGALTDRQKQSLAELIRLDYSLRGPDDQVDQLLYSRPPVPRLNRSNGNTENKYGTKNNDQD
jgi:hypothetical protein